MSGTDSGATCARPLAACTLGLVAGDVTTGATGGGTRIPPSGCGSYGINQTTTIRITIATKTLRMPHCLRIDHAEPFCAGVMCKGNEC